MTKRYNRNWLFVSPEQQEKIKNTWVIMGGAGLGSVIAEAALRLGFEKFIIIDGDIVDESNLNRQNYIEDILIPLSVFQRFSLFKKLKKEKKAHSKAWVIIRRIIFLIFSVLMPVLLIYSFFAQFVFSFRNKKKVKAIKIRIKGINENVKIIVHDKMLGKDTHTILNNLLKKANWEINDSVIAINALDFDNEGGDAPFLFDEFFLKKNIPIVHFGNLGWAAFSFVVDPAKKNDYDITTLEKIYKKKEEKKEKNIDPLINHLRIKLEARNDGSLEWIDKNIKKRKEKKGDPEPQLSVGAHLVAAQVTSLMFAIVCDVEFKSLPEIYFSCPLLMPLPENIHKEKS